MSNGNLFNSTAEQAKDLSDIEDYPLKGICGKCGNYAHKLSKDCLCENCIWFGVKTSTTDAIPYEITRLTTLRTYTIPMNILKLLIGKKVKVMTDAKVTVELVIKRIEENKHWKELHPATKENDWWPESRGWTTYEVIFENGFVKSYRDLSEIDIVE